jgi:hypothetical protein
MEVARRLTTAGVAVEEEIALESRSTRKTDLSRRSGLNATAWHVSMGEQHQAAAVLLPSMFTNKEKEWGRESE